MSQKNISKIISHMATKYDRGKPPLGIIPKVALAECAYALGVGVEKYSKHNYIQGDGLAWTRLADAALRHIYEFLGGVDFDAERPELHTLGCAMAELSMLIHLIDEGKGTDDRLEYGREGYGYIAIERDINLDRSTRCGNEPEIEEEEIDPRP